MHYPTKLEEFRTISMLYPTKLEELRTISMLYPTKLEEFRTISTLYPTKLEELLLFRNPTISEALVGQVDKSSARSKTLLC